MANRFEDVVSGLEKLLNEAVDVPVYSAVRSSPGRDRRAPFVRIERPIIEDTIRDKEGERFDVLFPVNVFSIERSNVEVFDLAEKVRSAAEGNKLDLDSKRAQILRPRHQGSTPLSQPSEDSSRRVKQRSIEFRIRISET